MSWDLNKLPPGITGNTNERTSFFEDIDQKHVTSFVREFIQNLMDAKSDTCKGPVKVEFTVKEDGYDPIYLQKILKELKPYLKEDGVIQKNTNKTILIAEEYGTTGLTGDLNADVQSSKSDHASYWFQSGKLSEKDKKDLGGAGQGEITYPMSSDDKVCFVLSVREGEKNLKEKKYLYGKCNLHKPPIIKKQRYTHTAFYGVPRKDNFPYPIVDKIEIEAFSKAFGLKRKNINGNSYVIPKIRENSGITERGIIISVIEEYFFPIIKNSLKVHVNNIIINEMNMIDEAFLNQYFDKEKTDFFLFSAERLTSNSNAINLPKTCTDSHKIDLEDSNFKAKPLAVKIKKIKKDFNNKKPVTITIPLTIHKQDGTEKQSKYKIHLKKVNDNYSSKDALLRGALNLRDENHIYGLLEPVFALTEIDENTPIADLVKLSEVPSHNSMKHMRATKEFKHARSTIEIIRKIPKEFAKLLLGLDDAIDANAYSDLFPVGKDGSGNLGWIDPRTVGNKCQICKKTICICPCNRCKKDPCICPCNRCKKNPCICQKELQYFKIEDLSSTSPGSYRVTNGGDQITNFPFEIRLKFAFGTFAQGNVIKKYKPTDFDLSNAKVNDPQNLEVYRKNNELILKIKKSHPLNFYYEIMDLQTDFEFKIEEK
jgi:hypothetical protein